MVLEICARGSLRFRAAFVRQPVLVTVAAVALVAQGARTARAEGAHANGHGQAALRQGHSV